MDNCRMNYRNNPSRRSCTCNPSCSLPDQRETPTIHWGDLSVAMGYIPDQHFHETFDLHKAFSVGTIFPELCKPFCGKGGGCSC